MCHLFTPVKEPPDLLCVLLVVSPEGGVQLWAGAEQHVAEVATVWDYLKNDKIN